MTQTHSPIPGADSQFLTALQAFLRDEDALRYADMFTDFVVVGGVVSVGAGFTKTPTGLTAYAAGYYLTEIGSVTFASGQTTYLIANKDTTGNVGGYTRVAGTHYLTAVAPDPGLPAGCIRLATVTTDGVGVTAVADTRNLFPLSQAQGGLAIDLTTATNGQLLIGNGSGVQLGNLTPGPGTVITEGPGTIIIDSYGLDTWRVQGNRSFVASNTTVTLVASAITLRSAVNTVAVVYQPGNVTNTVTTAGPVADGRDAIGAFLINSWVYFYWIWDGSTLASVSSATPPPVGPVLPTGYTHWAFCTALRFDPLSHVVPARVEEDWTYFETMVNILTAGTLTAETPITLTAAVPPLASTYRMSGVARVQGNGGGNVDTIATLRYITAKDIFRARLQTINNTNWNSTAFEATLPNIALFYLWTNNTNCTTNSLDLDVLGYKVS